MGESTDQSRHDVHLSLTEDRLAVLFSGAVPEAQRRELVDAITDELAVLGVAVIPSKAELWKVLSEAPPGEDGRISGVALVEGVAPAPSKDGWIEWTRDFFSSDFVVDEKTGAIDYRERTGDPSHGVFSFNFSAMMPCAFFSSDWSAGISLPALRSL